MGKRELLLIVAFVAVGAVVYQLTSPAAPPGEEGFSWSGLIENIRREVRGHRANAEVVTSDTHPLEAAVADLRLETGSAQVTIRGERRDDMAYELRVRSNGYDEAEAVALAKQTRLVFKRSAETVAVQVEYPKDGVQSAVVVLIVPNRLSIRAQPGRGRLEFSDLAGVELVEARGRVELRRIRGRVSVTHRGGQLTVEDSGTLRLNARGTDVRLARIAGEAVLQLSSGTLGASELSGRLEVDASSAVVELEALEAMRGPARINAVSGRVRVRGLATEARVEGRNTDIDIVIDRASPISIYNEGNDDIEVTPPPGGFNLDAVVTRGRLTLPESLERQLNVAPSSGVESEATDRAVGPVNGGGPVITLRANGGDIVVRARDTANTPR
ncbi:MAG TPA: hypothetical protein VLD67_15765 [Vicinamibacterales bacterium]|nr:hypothetical protein [Vicinamibacterales bacterium]